MNTISIIVARDENGAIGKDNQLPWHLPSDLNYFKTVTSGHTVIMGRKTYESMGKALPKRRNIVISRQQEYLLADAEVVNSVEAALDLCRNEQEVFVIGGSEIFRLALPLVNKLYITEIHERFDADTFLPEINLEEWQETTRVRRAADEKNRYDHSFVTYEKRPDTKN